MSFFCKFFRFFVKFTFFAKTYFKCKGKFNDSGQYNLFFSDTLIKTQVFTALRRDTDIAEKFNVLLYNVFKIKLVQNLIHH